MHKEELRCAVRRIYPRGPCAGVKEVAGFGSGRLCFTGSAASAAWLRAGDVRQFGGRGLGIAVALHPGEPPWLRLWNAGLSACCG